MTKASPLTSFTSVVLWCCSTTITTSNTCGNQFNLNQFAHSPLVHVYEDSLSSLVQWWQRMVQHLPLIKKVNVLIPNTVSLWLTEVALKPWRFDGRRCCSGEEIVYKRQKNGREQALVVFSRFLKIAQGHQIGGKYVPSQIDWFLVCHNMLDSLKKGHK